MNNNINMEEHKMRDTTWAEDPEQLLTERQAGDLLGLTPRALQAWRYRGGGPKFVRISSRAVRYRRRDLMEWVEERVRNSTSED